MRRSFIIAHRGASKYEVENTIKSFKKAAELGSDFIEFDLRRMKDGIVVFHDTNLFRLFGKKTKIYDIRKKSIERIKKKGIEIPLFDEVIEKMKDKNVRFYIEIKSRNIERGVVEIINKYEVKERCIVASFNSNILRFVKRIDPEIKISYISKAMSIKRIRRICKEINPDFLHLAWDCRKDVNMNVRIKGFEKTIKYIRKLGKNIILWNMVDNKEIEYMKRFSKFVYAFSSDDPKLIIEMVSE